MKTLSRLIVLVMLFAVLVPVVSVGAQEDDEIKSAYLLTASSGSFEETGDGVYTLTLNEVDASIVWLVAETPMQLYSLTTENVMSSWQEATDLTAAGALETEGLMINFDLASPEFDAENNVLTFTAVSNVEVRAVQADKADIPSEFGAANLSIEWTLDFQSGLGEGIMSRYEGVREMPTSCQEALDRWQQCRSDRTFRQQNFEHCMEAGVYLDVNCF